MKRCRILPLVFGVLLAASAALNVALFERGRDYYLQLNQARLSPLGLEAFSGEPVAAPDRPRLVFYGDSRAALWPAPAAPGWAVINRGIGAQTTAQVALRFDQHLAPLRPAAVVLSAAVATYGLLSLPFLLRTADDLVRQLFVFQFLRPPNGDPAIMLRIRAIRNYPESWLTVRLGLVGGGLLALRWLGQVAGRLGRREGQWPVAVWLPVLVWAVLVAASFAVSKTFYLYYYVQLAVPLALLGGSLLHPWAGIQDVRGRQRLRASAAKTLPGLAPLVIAAVLIALAAWRLPVQLRATVHGTQWVKTAHAEAGRYLNQQTAPGARLLVFEPNYAFLASRPPARLADGVFFIDSHAYMLYLNLGITQETWTSLLWRLVRRDMTDEQTVLWQKPAQDAVLGALANAEYVVLDPRARYLLAPDTLRQVQGATVPLASFADTSILRIW